MAGNRERLAQRRLEPFGDYQSGLVVAYLADHQHEFIAAHARQRIRFADAGPEPLGHHLQKTVPSLMT